MRNQQLFEAPFGSEVGTDTCSKYVSSQSNSPDHWRFCQGKPCIDSNGRRSICSRSGAGKCMCKRSQGEAPPPLNPNYESQWLFELPSLARENLWEGEAIEGENGGSGWFWQAIGEALSALKSATVYVQNRNLTGARQSLATARQRVNLAGKTMGQLALREDVKEALAFGHVAIQKAQRHLSGQNININPVLAELKKARGAMQGAMSLALKARSRVKVWN